LAAVGAAGPIFRTFDLRGRLTGTRLDPGDVARILRRRAAAAGVAGDFAGHSLRRGFITNAAKKKIPIESIKRVTGPAVERDRAGLRCGRDARRRPAIAGDRRYWMTRFRCLADVPMAASPG